MSFCGSAAGLLRLDSCTTVLVLHKLPYSCCACEHIKTKTPEPRALVGQGSYDLREVNLMKSVLQAPKQL
jgi:hypothetical protein